MDRKPYEPVVGDVVKLISGGPDMTVCKITPKSPAVPQASPPIPAVEASIECRWFDHFEAGHNAVTSASFSLESVDLVTARNADVKAAKEDKGKL